LKVVDLDTFYEKLQWFSHFRGLANNQHHSVRSRQSVPLDYQNGTANSK